MANINFSLPDHNWVEYYTKPRDDELAIGTIIQLIDSDRIYQIYAYHRTYGETWYYITNDFNNIPARHNHKMHPDWFTVLGHMKRIDLDIE